MPTDVKICGLKTAEALAAALDGGASHVGFIFFPKSPRNILPEEAGQLRRAALGRAGAVAVTVDADDALLDGIVAAMAPDMLQLHGKESPARVAAVKARYGLPVMKAFAVSEAADVAAAAAYEGIADRMLFDARPPKGAELPGGNGVPFDWRILDGVAVPKPWMLSGGLTPENVAAAVQATGARAVDVSSGVESARGVKSPERIRAFLAETAKL